MLGLSVYYKRLLSKLGKSVFNLLLFVFYHSAGIRIIKVIILTAVAYSKRQCSLPGHVNRVPFERYHEFTGFVSSIFIVAQIKTGVLLSMYFLHNCSNESSFEVSTRLELPK